MTFFSSRTLFGYFMLFKVRSVSVGMLSILRFRRRVILKVKVFVSSGIFFGRSRSGGR